MKIYISILVIFCSLVICCEKKAEFPQAVIYVKASSDKPSESCDFLGKINGATLKVKDGDLAKYESSLKDLKRGVSSLGGNYVHIQKVVRDGAMISGKAYHCDNF